MPGPRERRARRDMVLKFGVGDERRRAVLLFWEVASDYSSDEAGAFRRGSIHHGDTIF